MLTSSHDSDLLIDIKYPTGAILYK